MFNDQAQVNQHSIKWYSFFKSVVVSQYYGNTTKRNVKIAWSSN